MKLSELAKKAAALPNEIDFDWSGAEHFHDAVFSARVTTLPEAIEYTDKLRKRMADYAMGMAKLQEAYKKMRDVLLSADVD